MSVCRIMPRADRTDQRNLLISTWPQRSRVLASQSVGYLGLYSDYNSCAFAGSVGDAFSASGVSVCPCSTPLNQPRNAQAPSA